MRMSEEPERVGAGVMEAGGERKEASVLSRLHHLQPECWPAEERLHPGCLSVKTTVSWQRAPVPVFTWRSLASCFSSATTHRWMAGHFPCG